MKAGFKLVEAKENDPFINDLVSDNNFTGHPFVKTWMNNYALHLKEAAEPEMGAVRGQTTGDAIGAGSGLQVAATLEIFNTVIRGFHRYMSDEFVKKYVTDKVVFKIPKTEYTEAVAGPTTGEYPHSEKTFSYVTVDLSSPESERGAKVTWTRALLEDMTFDVQAEMLEGLGEAVAVKIMQDILTELATVTGGNMPSGAIIDITNPITWKEFLSVVAAVDIGVEQVDHTYKTYGPSDYVLVSPDIYWQLLDIVQLTNTLYQGSTEPINKGIMRSALGVTILKMSLLPAGTMYAVNSAKAIALVTRRTLKLEPILFPSWNEYGFIGTVRYGTSTIFDAAIQKATFSGS
jgi:hypothetical protein